MGQYYRAVLVDSQGNSTVFNRKVDGEYTLAKLTEHSWWLNEFVSTITKMLYHNPRKVAWVGDYCNDKGTRLAKALHKVAWGEDVDGIGVKKDEMFLDGLFLVNHTKKCYMNCAEFKKNSIDSDGWVMHPLPLLTAIGNGLGCGDYRGVNVNDIGTWCFDTIEVTDKAPENYLAKTYKFIDS